MQQQQQNDGVEEDRQVKVIEQALNAKKNELQIDQQQGAKSQPLKEQMKNQVRYVTKDAVNKVNSIFENDNPEQLSRMLEIFVSLLRNKNSKAVDVQLFFLDHQKLVSKMSKHETTAVSLDLVNEAEKQLQGLQNSFANAVDANGGDLSFANCFLEWSISFCAAAKIDLKLKKL